jgi:hypothetical protein
MRFFVKIMAALLLIFVIVTIHLGISYVFPFPWNKINIIFLAIVLSLVLFESGISVWITFFVHLFVEVYAPQPFGIIIFSSTISILCVYWLYRHLFTNRSWYSVMAMTFVALILYRLLYTILLSILYFWSGKDSIPFLELSAIYAWELFLTTVVSTLFYGILQLVSKPIQRKKIKKMVWTKI